MLVTTYYIHDSSKVRHNPVRPGMSEYGPPAAGGIVRQSGSGCRGPGHLPRPGSRAAPATVTSMVAGAAAV
jgi:hypothetical protein